MKHRARKHKLATEAVFWGGNSSHLLDPTPVFQPKIATRDKSGLYHEAYRAKRFYPETLELYREVDETKYWPDNPDKPDLE